MTQPIDDKEWDRLSTLGNRLNSPDTQSRVKFPEITGLCRTCSQAMIRRRQYSEVPQVICQASFEHPHRVPLDVTECSEYRRQGEMHIRDMQELAIIIDSCEKGGQYL